MQPKGEILIKSAKKRIHCVGIKGIGLSALAQFFAAAGARVTGSDIKEKFPADAALKRSKIAINSFSPKNIRHNLDLAIYSSAYNRNNPEIKKAVELRIPLKSYGEALAEVFNAGENKIVVAGSHGKTTTTALTGHLLSVAGFKPTVFLGGVSNNWQSNFKKGGNKWLVAEGDEYQKKFLFLKPDYLLITNIDFDHPDSFRNREEYRRAFKELEKQTARKILLGKKISPLFRKFLKTADFALLGEKNRENAFLVYRLAKELKIPDGKIKTAFKTFKGAKRRMEYKGTFNLKAKSYKLKAKIYDDYGHHPEEIKATLSALKEKYPDYKILAIFQPHTFSRTKALLEEFGKCFKKADFVYLLSTFSSAREQKPKENVDKLLLKEVKKHHSQVKFYPGSLVLKHSNILQNVGMFLQSNNENKLVILTMGAGDVYKIAEQLAAYPNKLF
ncbi:MAG: Mur ligase domain-containing protein [Candidatus Paceibacterota bacterium]